MEIEDGLFLEDDRDIPRLSISVSREEINYVNNISIWWTITHFNYFTLPSKLLLKYWSNLNLRMTCKSRNHKTWCTGLLPILCFRNNSFLPAIQLLASLRFYLCGTHQDAIGDFMVMHQTTGSRFIKKVSETRAHQG